MENKIDSAINEVLESKRLKEGASYLKKLFKIILSVGLLFFILMFIAWLFGIH